MGLSVEVGILADLKEADEEGCGRFREEFARLSGFLKDCGLPEHNEPEDCPVYSGDMFGYSGLHYLRRIDAHIAASGTSGTLPSPGDDRAADDPVPNKRCRGGGGVLSRLFGRKESARKDWR